MHGWPGTTMALGSVRRAPCPRGPDSVLPTPPRPSAGFISSWTERLLVVPLVSLATWHPPALQSSWYRAEVFLCLHPGRVWSSWSLLEQGAHQQPLPLFSLLGLSATTGPQGREVGERCLVPGSPREGGLCLVDRALSSGLVAAAKPEGSSLMPDASVWPAATGFLPSPERLILTLSRSCRTRLLCSGSMWRS